MSSSSSGLRRDGGARDPSLCSLSIPSTSPALSQHEQRGGDKRRRRQRQQPNNHGSCGGAGGDGAVHVPEARRQVPRLLARRLRPREDSPGQLPELFPNSRLDEGTAGPWERCMMCSSSSGYRRNGMMFISRRWRKRCRMSSRGHADQRLLGIQISTFRLYLVCRWSSDDF